ncbi:M15 family metallopeptidase [Ollibium composti]|uniref:M15 family metallopeptidase n=1 Tax=Ollibium composti TaxID=2675109 RepID=A0ABY2QCZ3_9HYPH|nr:M15 family metallopeptidase [Mesorhizobium composti]THF60016.1 M15 family metallopeptidase [Mesorhizobium composti]
MANLRQADFDTSPPAPDVVPGLGGSAYADELRGMIDRSFCFSEAYGVQQGRADRTGAQPDILEFERRLIKRAFKLGIPLWAHTVIRTSADQNAAFRAGHSKARAGQSPHNYGAAVDLVHGTKAWALTPRQWAIIGHLGKEVAAQSGLQITWGGDWEFYDPAHWELTHWRAIRAAYADGEDWDGRK